MSKKKILFGLLLVIVGIIGIVAVLASHNALLVHPKGIVAHQELKLILANILLMLVIIVPTYILLFVVVWKYCIKKEGVFDPEHTSGPLSQLMMWGLPSLIVLIMSIVTWFATHHLDPYKPLESDAKPLTIQVVALDWKWLFIYPEQGIATLNFMQIPEKTPIHLQLTADAAPMSSFWIPQLSGQIYSMTGMKTQLHLMADGIGDYAGRAVEINGDGYSDMTFTAKSTTQKDFEKWVDEVKKSSLHLTKEKYNDLVKHYIDKSRTFFSEVEKDLFPHIIHKYMYPTEPYYERISFRKVNIRGSSSCLVHHWRNSLYHCDVHCHVSLPYQDKTLGMALA